MWSGHAMEHYPAIKRDRVLTHATTWMSPENTLRRERSKTRKTRMKCTRIQQRRGQRQKQAVVAEGGGVGGQRRGRGLFFGWEMSWNQW